MSCQLKDEELMCCYKNGDNKAMEEIVLRYKNPVYRFIYRLCANAAEAEDLAQEVFLRVHQSRQDYEPTGRFSTWIFCIAHHLFISNLRRKKRFILWPRQKDDPEAEVEFASGALSPNQVAEANDNTKLVQKCIQGLPFLQKEALILCEYENLSYEEIARILRKNLGTIKTLIYRARENLKAKLLPYVNEQGGLQ